MLSDLQKKLVEEKGSALFVTLLLVILVFTIGIAILELTGTETKISHNQKIATQALFLAEAGVQMAIHQLELDPQWKAGYRNYPLGKGVIKEVKIENKLYSVRIESQGEVQGVGRRIRTDLTKIPVPFVYPLITGNLVLRPGANFKIEGDALHYGNFTLTNFAELEGFFLVDGLVLLDKGIVKGTISATGPILVNDEAQVEGTLVSGENVEINDDLPGESEAHSSIPILMPNVPVEPDLNWYFQRPHFSIEEPVVFIEELVSGIHVASGDLTVMVDESGSPFLGQIAVVVPGTVRISCNLIPGDSLSHCIFIIAEDIIVEPGVTQISGALLASGSIQVMGGSFNKEFYGTLQAPLVSMPPGTTRLTYYPLAGNHLVKRTQVLFQVTDWLEVMNW